MGLYTMALAMPVNPYEPPLLPADEGATEDEAPVAWPATGAFRYYQTLVWNTATPLPRVCVRSGLAADSTMTITARALIDDDGSLLSRDSKPREYALELPISVSGCKLQDWRHIGMYCLLLGLMCGAVAAFWPGPLRRLDPLFNLLPALVFGVAAVVLLAVGLRWMARPMRIQLLCVDRTYFQLFGLHPAFLESLPEWPVPDRDSVRRE
jgi:hypothetical protein